MKNIITGADFIDKMVEIGILPSDMLIQGVEMRANIEGILYITLHIAGEQLPLKLPENLEK